MVFHCPRDEMIAVFYKDKRIESPFSRGKVQEMLRQRNTSESDASRRPPIFSVDSARLLLGRKELGAKPARSKRNVYSDAGFGCSSGACTPKY